MSRTIIASVLVILAIGSIIAGIYIFTKQPTIQSSSNFYRTTTLSDERDISDNIKEIHLGNSYYKTGENIYYLYPEDIIAEADEETFHVPSQLRTGSWAIDKNNVYYQGKVINADPSTFIIIDDLYSKDEEIVFYKNRVINNSNPNSFERLSADLYAKDNNHVYYEDEIIADADPASIEITGSTTAGLPTRDDYYVKDNQYVYFKNSKVQNADPESFVTDKRHSKDQNYIFSKGKKLDLDRNSLIPLQYGIVLKDNKSVYYLSDYTTGHELLSNADGSTFEYIGNCTCDHGHCRSYYQDKNYVFINNEASDTIDSDTFSFSDMYISKLPGQTPLSISYAKDRNNIYYSCGEILEGANSKTFSNLGGGYAKDKNNVYYADEIIESTNPKTFIIVREDILEDKDPVYYGKDENYVYSAGMIIEDINPDNCTTETIDKCY